MDLPTNLIEQVELALYLLLQMLHPSYVLICKDYQNQNLMKKLVLQKKLMLCYNHSISLYLLESNPAPVKYAASLLGLCKEEIRLPLVKIKSTTQDEVKKALSFAKLI